jgi:hypothetical protein
MSKVAALCWFVRMIIDVQLNKGSLLKDGIFEAGSLTIVIN